MDLQRMRVGLAGRLMSPDGADIIAVLYSLDGNGGCGRLRPIDPDALFPAWLSPDARCSLSAYDGNVIPVAITLLKLPRQGWKNDDHFAEFLVRQVTH